MKGTYYGRCFFHVAIWRITMILLSIIGFLIIREAINQEVGRWE